MAEQLAERHRIPFVSADLADALRHASPDVVHVTTPPASHFPVALQCLDAGCHVYVEKPFTVTSVEAAELIRRARERRLHVTAGHNLQYTWESMEARRLIRAGFLGGPPVHVESYFTYSLDNPQYAKALLGDTQHWVRQLPGQLLHNIISHGIARLAEFLHSDDPIVSAFGHTSPLLHGIGEPGMIDELRVHVSDRRNMTGTFVFSTQLSPPLNGVRVYGPGNSVVVDNVHHTVVRLRRRRYKSYVNYVVPPVLDAVEQLRNAGRNMVKFLRADFHDDSGLKNCIEAFYETIREAAEPATSYREVLVTALIMDRIFEQLAAAGRPCADRLSGTSAVKTAAR
jgi:predicted dehydrogenase